MVHGPDVFALYTFLLQSLTPIPSAATSRIK